MFKIVSDPQFTHDVPVMVPVDGGHREDLLRTRFRQLRDDEMASADFETTEGIKSILRAAIVSFEDVVDDADKHIPMSDELREKLLAVPYIRIGLANAYGRAMAKARLGN